MLRRTFGEAAACVPETDGECVALPCAVTDESLAVPLTSAAVLKWKFLMFRLVVALTYRNPNTPTSTATATHSRPCHVTPLG
jgi:hypothetical protein